MGELAANETALLKRKLTLQKIFAPLVIAQVQTFAEPFGRTFALGLGQRNAVRQLRDLRHKTKRADVFLNYFETWSPQGAGVQYHLERAYLHLDEPRSDGTGDTELLALHCDPQIKSSDPKYRYKRGPHFHLSGIRPSFRKAHIATCLTSIDQTCSTVSSLTNALESMVQMIGDELLDNL